MAIALALVDAEADEGAQRSSSVVPESVTQGTMRTSSEAGEADGSRDPSGGGDAPADGDAPGDGRDDGDQSDGDEAGSLPVSPPAYKAMRITLWRAGQLRYAFRHILCTPEFIPAYAITLEEMEAAGFANNTQTQYWDPTRTRWAPDDYQRFDDPIPLPDAAQYVLIRARDTHGDVLDSFGTEVRWLESQTPLEGLPFTVVGVNGSAEPLPEPTQDADGATVAEPLRDPTQDTDGTTVATQSPPPSLPATQSPPPSLPATAGSTSADAAQATSPPPSYSSVVGARGRDHAPMVDLEALRARRLERHDTVFYGADQLESGPWGFVVPGVFRPTRSPPIERVWADRNAAGGRVQPMGRGEGSSTGAPQGRGVKRPGEDDHGEGSSTGPQSKRRALDAAPATDLGRRERDAPDRATGIGLRTLLDRKTNAAHAYARSPAALSSAAPTSAAPWSRVPTPAAAPSADFSARAFGAATSSATTSSVPAYGRPSTPVLGAPTSSATTSSAPSAVFGTRASSTITSSVPASGRPSVPAYGRPSTPAFGAPTSSATTSSSTAGASSSATSTAVPCTNSHSDSDNDDDLHSEWVWIRGKFVRVWDLTKPTKRRRTD
ncbi:hypothetical protein FA95DRAFT_1612694 [Auriscalpium vulgare]|uniref:Uncharacterized protein n=1 Tax=Auriscalpium vulgare TaxID=40419 RepID=A0ACB8R6N6_9AGAM|nr:hypothetical protein FA95DRAFT_1612694 [Auriscalpium vulgare]